MKTKALIVYDSLYGNTQQIAEAVAESLQRSCKVGLYPVSEVKMATVKEADLLIIGTPTHGGRPSPKILAWLTRIQGEQFSSLRVAVFDTRINAREVNFLLKLLIKTIGFAAPKMAQQLHQQGLNLVGQAGFIVKGKEGPLRAGQLAKAKNWAKTLV